MQFCLQPNAFEIRVHSKHPSRMPSTSNMNTTPIAYTWAYLSAPEKNPGQSSIIESFRFEARDTYRRYFPGSARSEPKRQSRFRRFSLEWLWPTNDMCWRLVPHRLSMAHPASPFWLHFSDALRCNRVGIILRNKTPTRCRTHTHSCRDN